VSIAHFCEKNFINNYNSAFLGDTMVHNVAIIGSGPAGYTAGLYTARASLKPILFLGNKEGGQLMLTSEVENFPGFVDGKTGPEMMEVLKKQAEKFGTQYIENDVIKFEKKGDNYLLTTSKETFEAKTVIIATGASTRWLGLESEKKYIGKGVSSCANCDAFFFKNKSVFVIGGGDSACEEALQLTKFAATVTMVHRRDELRASKVMQERVKTHEKMNIIWDSVVEEVLGDEKEVIGIKLKNLKTEEISEHKTDGIFVSIGHTPNTKIFEGLVDLDEKGYVKASRTMHTNLPGVFVCGDVQDTRYKQAITASGTGCMAALEAEWFIEGNKVEREN
jgi:thioredoxin reductase (NADPH)